jgi:hypothetical protein
MFTLRTPRLVSETSINFDPRVLEIGHCGLFRAPLHLAAGLMPEMAELVASVPVADPSRYELDIKVHMLMAGQYPCIPNWHTDMVDRDEAGLRFDLIEDDEEPMLLWISDGPETEFLARQLILPSMPGSHREIAKWLNGPGWERGAVMTQRIQPNCWWAMDRQTPHRGTMATRSGWRVFARVTPLALAPRRPVHSVIRRHAQVYLDAREFAW